ncbi:DUF6064 family protein [uncultured Bacteroides sp.]|jgi:hypothetical protein|uniref:DUF6064 family protein n=1 Tax=uncultured Bacteroides sp. TaxID=162156 RepID=UPI002AA6055B|nr:DUF6064 family protein [uncultured Bacteroides sp.]
MEIFWNTIGQYNAGTWVYQILITIIAIALTISLFRHPTKAVKYAMKIFLAFLNAWIAIVYYYIYCEPRSFNNIFAIFWGIMVLFWLYDLFIGHTPFERTYKYDKLSILLCLLPLIYPLFSLVRGLHFPIMTSPVMPCSVAVFTIGLLLAFSKKVNIFLVLFLTHWALIGFTKVYFFKIPEDFLLASSSVPALYLFFKEYVNSNLHKSSKPKARILNLLLITLCCIIGMIFTITMISELGKA